MITLNTDRGLVKVSSWQDVEELPGFLGDLDPKKFELKEIIGRYIFKDYIKCGLSSCHTPHGKGYIVTTKSGPVTNIGKDCGKKHFGIEFETLSRKLETQIQLQTYRETVGSFLIALDEHKERLTGLRNGPKGADAVYKKIPTIIKKKPQVVQKKLLPLFRGLYAAESQISCSPESLLSRNWKRLRQARARSFRGHIT